MKFFLWKNQYGTNKTHLLSVLFFSFGSVQLSADKRSLSRPDHPTIEKPCSDFRPLNVKLLYAVGLSSVFVQNLFFPSNKIT